MKPIKFDKSNSLLSGKNYSNVSDLPVYREVGMIISKWHANIRERIKFLFTGNIWFSIRQSETHAPIRLGIEYPFWTQKEIDKAKKRAKKLSKKSKRGKQ